MFYVRELAALLICWLFYCEFYWMIERRVLKVCSKQFIDKHCKSFSDRVFFTSVSGKARLGAFYYIHKYTVFSLATLTILHLLFGWIEWTHLYIRTLTTLAVIVLGFVAVIQSSAATEQICVNYNMTSRKTMILLKAVSVVSEVFLILAYLYFAWSYIG